MVILIFILGFSACSKTTASSTTPPNPTASVQTAATPTKPATPAPTPTTITTPLARPAAGKSQDLTFNLKSSGDVYNLVIYLANGETLDLDWKFVANPQVGIRFWFTAPDGREMNAKSQPLNLPGHPLYDPKLPSLDLQETVGTNVVIKVNQNSYFAEGYYNLVFTGSPAQSGTVYLRYDLALPPTPSPTK
jgi:hypothetical protein